MAGAAALLAAASMTGCRQDMHDQPKYIPLRASTFFKDQRSARTPIPNTVARGNLRQDAYFYTGKIDGKLGDQLPMPLTPALLQRGQERFNVYCTPCHSRLGDGNGMIVQRGLKHPPSYHEERLKKEPIAHFYDVMTNGYGAMLNYSAQIPPEDRWAIAAYIRVLQLSQDASVADVPEAERAKIQKAIAAPALEMNNTPAHVPGNTPEKAPAPAPAKAGAQLPKGGAH